MVRLIAVVSLAAVLAACASSPPLVDRLSRGKVEGDQARVSIEGGRLDALPLAMAHCAKYGRSAQWDRAEDGRSVYRCVARP